MRTGTPSARPCSKVSRDPNGKPCSTVTRSCTKRSNVGNLHKNRKAKALFLARSNRQKGEDFPVIWAANGRSKHDPTQGWTSGQSIWRARQLPWQTHRGHTEHKCGMASSATSDLWSQRRLARFAVGMMEGMSSDEEAGHFSSVEEGQHKMDNFVLCSFAHHACSPFLQGFLHEEELCVGCDLSLFRLTAGFFCVSSGTCGRNSIAKETSWPTRFVSTESVGQVGFWGWVRHNLIWRWRRAHCLEFFLKWWDRTSWACLVKVSLKTWSWQGRRQMVGRLRTAGRWVGDAVLRSLSFGSAFLPCCWGVNLVSRHLGCRCCTKFRHSRTGSVVT